MAKKNLYEEAVYFMDSYNWNVPVKEIDSNHIEIELDSLSPEKASRLFQVTPNFWPWATVSRENNKVIVKID